MSTANYLRTDHNAPEATTVRWFELQGEHYGTKFQFRTSEYGVVERGEEIIIVDRDGAPLDNDDEYIAVRSTLSAQVAGL